MTNNTGTVIGTVAPMQFLTKYVLMHLWFEHIRSTLSAVSIIVSFSLTSVALINYDVNVSVAQQSTMATDLSLIIRVNSSPARATATRARAALTSSVERRERIT